jgi:FMN phosphatase YigB (HAD superfamily)
MTLTLLIDLDDTLLGNDMDTFIPAYLRALGKHLAPHIDTSRLTPIMLAATQNMFQNNRPDRTLKEAFDPDFYPALGVTESQIRQPIDEFYAEVFPALSGTTQPRPEAVEVIDEAFRRGWKVAIATNPLFPLAAIQHRLDWAGLSPQKYPFAIVPSYESFHFAKPNPAYFAELLARFGWPRGATVMVGNDADHDVRGAQQIGIPTFWVSNGSPYPEGFPAPSASGEIVDLIPWLESIPEDQLQPNYTSPSAIAAVMAGIPAALASMTDQLNNATWLQHPAPNEWSLTEIACHLRDVEIEINLPRLKKIVNEQNPFITGIDSDTWAAERAYQSQDGQAALQAFIEARLQTLDLLNSISAEDWQRPAQHTIFGPTRFAEIASIIAGHDRLHIRQVYAQL